MNDSAAFPDTESQQNIYLYTYTQYIESREMSIIMFTDKNV